MRKLFTFIFILTITLCTGCGSKTSDDTNKDAKRYPFRGEILTVDKAAKKASIKHDKIDGYMEPMTMDFEIRKPDWVWNELVKGTVVTGDLVVNNAAGEYWLEITGVIAPQSGSQESSPLREDKAAVGEQLADFKLTNQDSKSIGPNDFKGKALAITFIYSQCPLPEYCILMSKNFSDAANLIAGDPELKDSLRLLSISFDPARDTPEKLKAYGLGYLGKDSKAKDFSVWQLAVGPDPEVKKIADFAGLRYEVDENNKTQFNHSLRTLVIGPDGKVFKVLSGNDWKPNDLIEALKEASKQKAKE